MVPALEEHPAKKVEVRHTQTRQTQDSMKTGGQVSRSPSWGVQGSGLTGGSGQICPSNILSHFVPKDFTPPKVASMSVFPNCDLVHISCLSECKPSRGKTFYYLLPLLVLSNPMFYI